MRIGIDVDGVLADFNTSFIDRVISVTGRDLFPARPFDIPMWNYPEHYGYTTLEVTEIWRSIKADHWFWYGLGEYHTTAYDMEVLGEKINSGHDVYFITARPGINAKWQTELWLALYLGHHTPTVLVTSYKGLAARTLDLDIYVDDRWENALDVATTNTRSFLLNRPWNTEHVVSEAAITRISSVSDMFHSIAAIPA